MEEEPSRYHELNLKHGEVPSIKDPRGNFLVPRPNPALELETQKSKALLSISESLATIANFLSSNALPDILSAYARTNCVGGILNGLASHAGRNSLDARTLNQNALEIVEQVEAVFDKFAERLKAKSKRDPDLHDAETDYLAFKKQSGVD